jgi:hypothetical protein
VLELIPVPIMVGRSGVDEKRRVFTEDDSLSLLQLDVGSDETMDDAAGMHPLFVIPAAVDFAMCAVGIVIVAKKLRWLIMKSVVVLEVHCLFLRHRGRYII